MIFHRFLYVYQRVFIDDFLSEKKIPYLLRISQPREKLPEGKAHEISDINHYWLVVDPPSEKYEFFSWDDEIPNWMELDGK